eukprot:scaffold1085_cov252-Pinguiococcus_pyrenoidosus.AAC.13
MGKSVRFSSTTTSGASSKSSKGKKVLSLDTAATYPTFTHGIPSSRAMLYLSLCVVLATTRSVFWSSSADRYILSA